MTFRLWSNDLTDGGTMPNAQVLNGMGHNGDNISPHLAWEGAPEGTRSFVLNCYDPDAPTGSGWWHWVVANIPAGVSELKTGAGSPGGALPASALQTRTDFGSPGYGGAAPPPGAPHRYIFTIFALSVPALDINADVSAALVGFLVNMNKLGQASLTVQYGA